VRTYFVCRSTNNLLHSRSAYDLTAIYLAKLRSFEETLRNRMWPKETFSFRS